MSILLVVLMLAAMFPTAVSAATVDAEAADIFDQKAVIVYAMDSEGNPMENVEYKVTNNTTGESVVIVTDSKGYADLNLDEYGSYKIEELPGEANEGKEYMNPTDFEVKEDNHNASIHFVIHLDKEPEVSVPEVHDTEVSKPEVSDPEEGPATPADQDFEVSAPEVSTPEVEDNDDGDTPTADNTPDENGEDDKTSGNVTEYPKLTTEHISYLNGYNDSTVKPNKSITRAEAAAIFYRLLEDQGTADATFTDVPSTAWYANEVNYLSSLGILKGYSDGSFKPNKAITRAEFSAIASRFDNLDTSETNVFEDVSEDNWAAKYINSAYAKGWITGYANNKFNPSNDITRAEVVTLVNRMLNREHEGDFENIYTDINKDNWSYDNILEASIDHEV